MPMRAGAAAYAICCGDVDAGPTAAAGRSARSYITPEGAKKLRAELDQLWTVERPRVTQEVADAAAQGDRSENAEYIYGKRRLREIDRRVRFLSQAARRGHGRQRAAERSDARVLRRVGHARGRGRRRGHLPDRRRRRVRRRQGLDQHGRAGRARRCSASATATRSWCGVPRATSRTRSSAIRYTP